jgi:hypothetical protein
MSDSDQLLTKADALLAKWRVSAIAPSPPADYPVLTDVVIGGPDCDLLAPLVPIPDDTIIPTSKADVVVGGPVDVPILESFDAPVLENDSAPAKPRKLVAPLAPAEDLPRLPSLDRADLIEDDSEPSLEERVSIRVLQSLESRIQAYLDERLPASIEVLARELAAQLSVSACDEMISQIRDAVRTAVAEELEAQRPMPPTGH